MKTRPEDPYSVFSSYFSNKCQEIFKIIDIRFKNILNNDFKYTFYMDIYLSYKGSIRKAVSYSPPINNALTDTFKLNTQEGLQIFVKYYKEIFEKSVIGFSFTEIDDLDKLLLSRYDQILMADDVKPLGKIIMNTLSFSIQLGVYNFKETQPHLGKLNLNNLRIAGDFRRESGTNCTKYWIRYIQVWEKRGFKSKV
jgi:hypothetical protein